jgi:hypothetical protein
MDLPTDFKEFLQEIRPSANQRSDLQTGHKTLRDRLNADEDLKECLVSDFLQGSYRFTSSPRMEAMPESGASGSSRVTSASTTAGSHSLLAHADQRRALVALAPAGFAALAALMPEAQRATTSATTSGWYCRRG